MTTEATFDELRLTLRDSDPSALIVELHGRSTSREPGKQLVPYFADLLKRAVERNGRIEVHFEKLEHFNSSTISALIQIINQAQSKKVRLAVFYDATQHWQTLSFDALKRALKPFDALDAGMVTFQSS